MKNIKYLILLILLIGKVAVAQKKPISIDSALAIASKNNLTVKNEKIRLAYLLRLTETSRTVPFANITGDFGQVNSKYFDSRIGISQSFSLPKAYQTHKNVLIEEMRAVELGVLLKEAELKKAVLETFYTIIYLQQKEKLLNKYQGIYEDFFQKIKLRLDKGESNILEKTTAQAQLDRSALERINWKTEMDFYQIKLRFLLNTDIEFEPISTLKLLIFEANDAATLKEHPELKILEQQIKIGESNTELEKSKTLPTFNIGYANGSIIGIGADEVKYGGLNRFHAMQLGMAIPIFKKAQKAKVASLQINQQLLESEQKLGFQHLENEYAQALSQYKHFAEAIKYFEEKTLPNVKIVEEISTQQLASGVINYLDWLTLANQAQRIDNEYIDTMKLINETVIRLNYFYSK